MKKSARNVPKKATPKVTHHKAPTRTRVRFTQKTRTDQGAQVVPVPLRTTARVFAENQATLLGVTLTKAQKRKAIDRIEKVLRAKRVEPAPERLPTPDPLPENPAPQSLIDAAADARKRDALTGQGTVGHRLPPPSISTRHPLPPMGNIGTVPTSAPRRPLDAAMSLLEESIGSLFEVAGTLSAQLTSILPHGFDLGLRDVPNSVESSSPLPSYLGNHVAKIQGLTLLLRDISSALSI